MKIVLSFGLCFYYYEKKLSLRFFCSVSQIPGFFVFLRCFTFGYFSSFLFHFYYCSKTIGFTVSVYLICLILTIFYLFFDVGFCYGPNSSKLSVIFSYLIFIITPLNYRLFSVYGLSVVCSSKNFPTFSVTGFIKLFSSFLSFYGIVFFSAKAKSSGYWMSSNTSGFTK